MFKTKLDKKSIKKAIESSSSLKVAAGKLKVDRRQLYTARVKLGMPVAQRG